ncbi:MAG TPA: SDR family oxidoreductase, partial [Tahibacter sp.]|nr:SDR family oxidoreductase [Tahibacter sp.]
VLSGVHAGACASRTCAHIHRRRRAAARWGDPADLGGAAVFLASRAADYVHGAVLPVDGGWLAR